MEPYNYDSFWRRLNKINRTLGLSLYCLGASCVACATVWMLDLRWVSVTFSILASLCALATFILLWIRQDFKCPRCRTFFYWTGPFYRMLLVNLRAKRCRKCGLKMHETGT